MEIKYKRKVFINRFEPFVDPSSGDVESSEEYHAKIDGLLSDFEKRIKNFSRFELAHDSVISRKVLYDGRCAPIECLNSYLIKGNFVQHYIDLCSGKQEIQITRAEHLEDEELINSLQPLSSDSYDLIEPRKCVIEPQKKVVTGKRKFPSFKKDNYIISDYLSSSELISNASIERFCNKYELQPDSICKKFGGLKLDSPHTTYGTKYTGYLVEGCIVRNRACFLNNMIDLLADGFAYKFRLETELLYFGGSVNEKFVEEMESFYSEDNGGK